MFCILPLELCILFGRGGTRFEWWNEYNTTNNTYETVLICEYERLPSYEAIYLLITMLFYH